MKEKIIYTVSFLLAFVLVTGILIFMNSMFNNIFKFDFSPIKQASLLQNKVENPAQAQNPAADSLKQDSLKAKLDSLAVKPDSTAMAAKENQVETKNEDLAKTKVAENKKGVAVNKKEIPAQLSNAGPTQNPTQTVAAQLNSAISKSKKDSTYASWVKQTVKLYESMDSRKAAKVIQGYSDNIARDILLKMKKKKAAEILAELKPEVVTRIISVN